MTEEELKKGLIALGWKWVYVHGHGQDEPVSEGEFVVGEIEKDMVLVPPTSLFKEPIPYEKYF